MKIDKKLIKELVENLDEFNLTELEYQDGEKRIKVSKTLKASSDLSRSAVVVGNKSVLADKVEEEGIRVK